MRVKPGRVVLLDYLVKVGTGEVVESSSAKGPIEYLHGVAQLRSAGVPVDEKVDRSEFGNFGWATDPEGNRFELWEPPAK
jgi:FKBP-type peptidyl-prolyl cis-trans isomerase 2